jgi:hypothetical protein
VLLSNEPISVRAMVRVIAAHEAVGESGWSSFPQHGYTPRSARDASSSLAARPRRFGLRPA